MNHSGLATAQRTQVPHGAYLESKAIGSGAPGIAPVSEIDHQFNRLRLELTRLEELQATLAARLNPVMPPSPTGGVDGQTDEPSPTSSVGQQLFSARCTVERVNGYITTMLRDLAL